MASTGINGGELLKVSFDGTTAAYLINVSENVTHEPRETTNKDSTGGRKTYSPGLVGASGTATMYFAEDSSWNYSDARSAAYHRTTVTVVTLSGVAGDKQYSQTAYFTSASREGATIADNMTCDVAWVCTGNQTESAQS